MAHRSNQAVASQEPPAPHPPENEQPRPARRLLIGWTTALAALGASTAVLALAVWLLRFPIAEFMLGAALAERGAEADFDVAGLDLGGAVLTDIRFGAETEPDAAVERIEARWEWVGVSPRLRSVRLVSPHVRIRLAPNGEVSMGALSRMRGTPGPRRPAIPAIELEIENGTASIEAPFGALDAVFQGEGTLGRDFAATARIAETSRAQAGYALEGGAAELIVVSRENNIAFRLNADARRLTWSGAEARDAHVRVMGRTPLDLARYDVEAAWRLASLRGEDFSASHISGAAGAEAVSHDNALSPEVWQGQARFSAADLSFMSNAFQHVRFDARGEGQESIAQANWTLAAQRFAGLAMVSEQPSAAGALTVDLETGDLRGQAQLALARSRLNERAQQRIRSAFPDIPAAPVGPTFAQAERALDRAADRFDITIPLALTSAGDAVRLYVSAPAEARAASGARLRLSPLRQDAPAVVMQWPGAAVHGVVAVELSGGGAPTASLLLDTVDWSPDAPFEADGTLALSNWRAQGASIAAEELGISIAVQPDGRGRIDLRGPARITGPLGDGQVRDLVPTLDVAISWKPGWRVTPNRGCLPTRLGGLDAAGLSFANGAFALCALNDTLIAADANNSLSGGFIIRQLALNGHMGGAQPARLSSSSVAGRFGGRTGDVRLALQADAPRLAIDMAEGRTLAVVLARMTAEARIADSWSVVGAFEQGELTDPALPGSVSTIEGRWSAAPENGRPVVRVEAGEALLTANRPDDEENRPLFNPLRLIQVDATLREGEIDAHGAILLEEGARQLAVFEAHHDVDAGVGAAQVTASSIVFNENLQPFEITEQARGIVENVRGPASAVADIAWTREDLNATGHVRLEGVSFATSTMPIVQNVRGDIYFDDLFNLTTPPGQNVTIGMLNPGIAVHNGAVRFQLLPEEQVSIENAVFDFAGGVLAMSPATVTIGQPETRIVLTLGNVDASNLIASLNIPDLAATGRVEGSFPLLLTSRTAYIEHGVLRALPGGGFISYTGNAGQNATGVSRIAFDALRSFRYDSLELTLDGDISGDVVTSIEFSGQNSGRPVDLGPIAPVPGLGRVTVRGVPFNFNVRVTAPFRRLAQTAASITDPGLILDRAYGEEEPDPVDQPPSPPR
jgi:hypothetical protein